MAIANSRTVAPRILVVDDDPMVVQLVSDFLSEKGFELLTAEDGAEGVARAAELPDLILLDIGLPKLDGYEVCRWLREDEQTRAIPIIVMTGRRDFAVRETAMEAGANDFFFKPVDLPRLLVMVRQCLGMPSLAEPEQSGA